MSNGKLKRENCQLPTVNSQLKKGYKQTEVGVIPSDWVVKLLGEIVYFLDDKRRPIKDSNRAKMKGQYPYYGASGVIDFINDYIFDEELILLGEDGENILSRNVRLVFKINGKVWVNNHAHVLKPKEGFDVSYLTEKLESLDYEQYNTGTAQPKLNQRTCWAIPIALPPTKAEQNAIATVLSDTDALISSLEKLIAKKRNIKQGVMQELLRSKEEWEMKKLGEVATLKARIGWQGLTTAEYKKSGDYFLVTGTEFKNGFIDWENCFYVEEERYKQDKNIQIKEHDVLVTKDGTIGKVALIKSIPKPATLNSGVFVIRPINNSFNPEFFYYLLLSEVFLKFLSQLSAGSTINHLYQKDFVSFQFLIPKTIEEQKIIAQVLSDMDAEIEVLEKKLDKFRMIKQGMMQDLLTGKIRLL
ncbi:Type-1 restriction enzyme EcoKI specificity protein [Candidatus Brocadiaceae bacterium B188]|nr:restriction endonuclease subunit S [Candidatus Brocadia sapporoensis]RZV59614.1 MAG: restriction endonuclease subunit S [Candidatus Brocadia sp. BROELEC01]TWU50233.1 Type-1 restriction enzyme EcoKI specificity protein [Candidatus Brocadiaceae bacterium B188]